MGDKSILIRNALIIPGGASSPPAFTGWLLIEGRRIADLGPGPPPDSAADQVIDGRDRALLPGLVNAHTHSHSSLTRGSAEGLPLEAWLEAIEREQAQLTEEQAYHGALATYCEALLSGTSSIVDMCLFPAAAIQAAEEVGIRAIVVPYVADAKPFTPTLTQTERLLAGTTGTATGRVWVWCGLHDLESCSDAQIRDGVALAKAYDTGIHLHCSETQGAVEKTLRRTGRRPVAHLSHLGVTGSLCMG